MDHKHNDQHGTGLGRDPEKPTPEDKIVRGNDLVYMMQDFFAKINERIIKLQSMAERRFRMVNNGRVVVVADRYVDIDCEALSRIPYIRDNDRIIVMADETHAGQSSVYKIYNTASVPNVKYLGYAEPEAYPTVAAVEHYVSTVTAKMEHELEQKIQVIRNEFDQSKTESDTKLDLLKTAVEELMERVENLG